MSIIDLNHYSLLKISGSDKETFLQGQLSCNVNEITEQQSSLGAHCNPKGRVMSFFRLFQHKDALYMLMPSNVIEQARDNLRKYAIFFKVALEILTFPCYGLLGKEDVILDYPGHINAVVSKGNKLVIQVPGNERYVIIDFAHSLTFKASLSAQWHQLDIENGIPRLYPETIDEFLPHYLNLPQLGAISFNKGCYTGQEIIARMHNRGKLKKRMVCLLLPRGFKAGEKIIIQDTNLGICVDSLTLNSNQVLTLALMQDKIASENKEYIKPFK